MTFRDDVGDPL